MIICILEFVVWLTGLFNLNILFRGFVSLELHINNFVSLGQKLICGSNIERFLKFYFLQNIISTIVNVYTLLYIKLFHILDNIKINSWKISPTIFPILFVRDYLFEMFNRRLPIWKVLSWSQNLKKVIRTYETNQENIALKIWNFADKSKRNYFLDMNVSI